MPWKRVVDIVRASELAVALIEPRRQHVIALSPAAAAIGNHRTEEIVGRPIAQFVAGAPSGALDLLLAGKISSFEIAVRPAGRAVEVRVWARLLQVGSSRFALCILLPADVGGSSSTTAVMRTATAGQLEALRDSLAALTDELRTAMGKDAAPGLNRKLLAHLGDREREVTLELLRGNRVLAIAKSLYLSPGTVRNHLSSAYRKLGVNNQQELIDLMRSAK